MGIGKRMRGYRSIRVGTILCFSNLIYTSVPIFDQAWAELAERRYTELVSGDVKPVIWDDKKNK